MCRGISPTRQAALLAATLALVIAGCSSGYSSGGDASEGPRTTTTAVPPTPTALEVTSTDFAYALDTPEVAAGLVEVSQDNEGEEVHQVTLVQLEEGQSVADVVQGFEGPEGDHFVADEAFAGGPTNTLPGQSGSAIVELEEGRYGMYCFIATSDGRFHLSQGMVGQLDVVATEAPPVEPPATTETVRMSDFTYDVPAGFTGQGVIEVVNDGPQVHELTISAPDLSTGSGLAAIAPGATAYLPIDLDPGSYNFVCFVSDSDSGDPHFTVGMNLDITVPGGG